MHDLWAQFTGREAGPLVQFVKYALCGGVALAVDMVVFYFAAWRLFPALRADDPLVRRLGWTVPPVAEEFRARRFVYATLVAFFFSNLTAYGLNVLWVFEPGRHAWWVELGLFYAVSGFSIALGAALGWLTIRKLHWSTTASYAGKLLAALLVNFAGRKFVIFRG